VLKNILYFIGSIVLFFAGVVVYGIVLNLGQVTLEEAIASSGLKELGTLSLVIDRTNNKIDLLSDNILLKSYKAVFGQNSKDGKILSNDRATPIGVYKICAKSESSKYWKILFINYPNEDDALRGLKLNYINNKEYIGILNAHLNGDCPPDTTALGGRMGIHGTGDYDFLFKNLPFVFNWTDGSAAISNEDIDELFPILNTGTRVVIRK